MFKKILILLGGLVIIIAGYYVTGLSSESLFIDPPQSSPDAANYYRGTVTNVNSDLEFTLDCCSQVLQLGLVEVSDRSEENIGKIESIMKQSELSCTAMNMGSREVEIDTVYCSTVAGLLSERLISEGLVEENCERTANQFGTCS